MQATSSFSYRHVPLVVALALALLGCGARQSAPEQNAREGTAGQAAPEEEKPPPPPEPAEAPPLTGEPEGTVVEVGAAPGLLVLSETYYPAWKAYVDGRPARLYRADHLLRAVPVPAGEHAVELRYESVTLRVGITISLVTGAIFLALAVAARLRPRKNAGTGTAPAPPGSVEGGAP